MTQVLKLFDDCIPVKGATRSLLCDTGRGNLHLIPNSLYEMLETYDGESLEDIYNAYGTENGEVVNEYVSFLIENELAFYTDKAQVQHFPKLDMTWDYPGAITNAIFDFKPHTSVDIAEVVAQLEMLGCFAVQLRFFYAPAVSLLDSMMLQFEERDIRQVELILQYSEEARAENLNYLYKVYSRISSIMIYGAPHNSIATIAGGNTNSSIIYLTETNISEKNCGIVHPDFFFANSQLVIESQQYNNCLNRKISIDADGNIKNCPSMQQTYGNIKDTTLQHVLQNLSFAQKGSISKDKIDICRDCEFRYICIDCRAYLENPANLYSKPLKCGYDPYIAQWQHWADLPHKQAAIHYYQLREII